MALLAATSAARDAGFNVVDSIEMTTFSVPATNQPHSLALRSPDRSYFLVVTSRGIVESDQVESTLWVYGAAAIHGFLNGVRAEPPQATVLARVTSRMDISQNAPYAAALSAVHWAPDSRTIYFLVENSHAERQLSRVSVAGGRVETLTPPGLDVEKFDVSRDTVAYLGARDTDSGKYGGDQINSAAAAVTGSSLASLLFPDSIRQTTFDSRDLTLGFFRDPTPAVSVNYPTAPAAMASAQALVLSPDGRSVIESLPVRSVPTGWNAYLPSAESFRIARPLRVGDRDPLAAPSPFDPNQYVKIDVDSGRATPLVRAPLSWSFGYPPAHTKAEWSRDGKQVLVTGTYLPLDGEAAAEVSKRLRPCDAAVVQVSSGAATCISFSTYRRDQDNSSQAARILLDAAFNSTGNRIVLTFNQPLRGASIEFWRFSAGQWHLENGHQEGGGADATDLSLFIQQKLDEPPRLWALDAGGGRSKQLWNPNPQLGALRLGTASLYRWRDPTGYEWTGGLVKPVDYTPGKRYPLVIQTYTFDPRRFLVDGMATTAEAALPLASAGIVVLQINKRFDNSLTDREAAEQLPGFAAAIEQLAGDGLIDPDRVGIIGFSRGCYYVESALIKMPDRFAAATLADGTDQSYLQYRLFDITEGDSIYGTKPNGAGLPIWLSNAPSFNLDKVRAALRIEALGPVSLLAEWEIYSALRSEARPVDLIYVPHGQHILQRPLERLASQQGNVDWFRFWLQGYEDTEPRKMAQYRRWEQLCEQQIAGHDGRPTFCVPPKH